MKDLADVKWICPVCGHENTFHVHAADVRLLGMTNADRIRSMSDEELAEMMSPNDSGCPPIMRGGTSCLGQISCQKCWLDWLKQEVEA